MSVRVRYRERAVADLNGIKNWGVDHWGADRTDEFLAGMRASIDRLARFPELGRLRPLLAPRLRSITFSGYVIFYVAEPAGPIIAAILHERRNHAALDFADTLETDL